MSAILNAYICSHVIDVKTNKKCGRQVLSTDNSANILCPECGFKGSFGKGRVILTSEKTK